LIYYRTTNIEKGTIEKPFFLSNFKKIKFI